MPPLDPRDHAPVDLVERARQFGVDDPPVRRLLAAVLGRGDLDPRSWNRASQVPRRLADACADLPRLEHVQTATSARDGFQKLLLRTSDGLLVETVLIPLHRPGAVSVCLSSQVGCAMGCRFCATARMEARRSLETWEILDQWIHARGLARSQGRTVTGAVFMGMGEPFLNYDRVLAAAELLRFPYDGSIAGKAITISTVGIVPRIEQYTDEKRRFRLAISLGAATDAKRAELVPVAARTPVAQVMAAARRHALERRTRAMLPYVCISGFNVGEDDARALADLIGDTPARLTLIDVEDPTGQYQPPTPGELSRFRDALSRYLGQPIARRYSGGADIQAACGTLAGIANAGDRPPRSGTEAAAT